MSPAYAEIEGMVARLPLGRAHDLQERAVATALGHLLVEGRRGVVLADEVGFGKTYEALAVMALLCDYATHTGATFERVLVLCKPALLRKWWEEVSSTRPGRGFPRYLAGAYWRDHPVQTLVRNVHLLERRWSADELREDGLRGHREEGRVQVPGGLYIANHDLLGEAARRTRTLLRQCWRTRWDLIIVDEAHHYAKWNKPAYIFAPNGDFRDYDQGISEGQFERILALTATPFELTPYEMVNLLALVRADPADLDAIKIGLKRYVEQLDRFFDLRQRSPSDPIRKGTIEKLRRLRDEDALGTGRRGWGLQALLRRYTVRNTKTQQERRYFLVNKRELYECEAFDKLEDLRERVRVAPLLPFDGPDALLYLELRELIQETVDRARQAHGRRTFVATDLRQGLSSYRQLAASALLQRDLGGARRLRELLGTWNAAESRRLHPKVKALVGVLETVARYEIEKVRRNPDAWFSKVLVFNKMIEGTAPQLREELDRALGPIFGEYLEERLAVAGLGPRKSLEAQIRAATEREYRRARRELLRWAGDRCRVPAAFQHEDLSRFAGRPLIEPYRELLLRRARQTLFLLRAVLDGGVASDDAVVSVVRRRLLGPVETGLRGIIDRHLNAESEESADEASRVERAERDTITLLEECRSVDLVGRYDGATTRDREAHRRNFNLPYNPFVLLVSRVGEEGIDLQEQCRYVIHYDLEWNPAKMEQREGRVDREGWGRANEDFIDVRFMLLKGTYEERIFHTVMQRDQWFQILIGSKRRELGEVRSQETEDVEEDDPIEEVIERGRLTEEEKAAVMLDLRPSPAGLLGGGAANRTP